MITFSAPAKINLTLEVLGEREDAYHEVRSVLQTIDLCDYFHFHSGRDTEIKSRNPGWLPEKSLVTKAVGLLRNFTGYSGGAVIEVDKHIPLLSGLGGDSSDAAAVLRGLNQLWALNLSSEEMLKLALQLGSDVPFFLYGGTALVEGRGEEITPLPPLPSMWVVLLAPSVSRVTGKTARLYASLHEGQYTDGKITDAFVVLLSTRNEILPSALFNIFDAVADSCYGGLRNYRRLFQEAGASEVHLAGSGPALFTLVKDKSEAEQIYQKLKRQGLECYLAQTLSANEASGS